jgi:AcrR family transcriptional regulator
MPARKPNSGARPAIPGKLAPGMRLPRELVAESQRARLGIALVELVDAQGFADTSLADLTARAHVARAAFYEHFGSMEGCFAAAYDDHLARGAGQLVITYNAPGVEDGERARAALSALAAFAQVWPAAARVCLGDVLTVAHGTVEAREQLLEGASALLDSALGTDGVHTTRAPVLVTATIGAIRRALYVHLRERPARELLALAEQIFDWVRVYGNELSASEASGEGDGTPHGEGQANGEEGAGGWSRMGLGADGGPVGAGSLSSDMGTNALPPDDGPKERILAAVLRLAANGEGESISLADIAATAGVSFGTFYKHFRTSQDALLAACEAVHERLIEQARAAYAAALDGPVDEDMIDVAAGQAAGTLEGAADDDDALTFASGQPAGKDGALRTAPAALPASAPAWAVGIARALGAYLAAVAADPAATRTMVLGSLSLGRPGLEFLDRRAQALERLLGPGLRAHPDLPPATADMLAGAILELVHDHALRGQLERLPDIYEQLTYIVLTPLLAAHEGHPHAEHPLESPHASTALATKRARARR